MSRYRQELVRKRRRAIYDTFAGAVSITAVSYMAVTSEGPVTALFIALVLLFDVLTLLAVIRVVNATRRIKAHKARTAQLLGMFADD